VTSRKTPFRLAHHLRHQAGIAELRNIISGNTFGKLVHVAMQWGFWLNETSANASWKLNASQSTKCPLNSLTLDFEEATIHIPDALSEKSFAKMEVISQNEATTREFEPVNLYGKEVEDFIAFLEGQPSVGTTIQEACRAVH